LLNQKLRVMLDIGAPAYYLTVVCVLGLSALITIRKTSAVP